MAILLYCVAKVDAPAPESMTGVAGDPVIRIEVGDLAAFVSSNPDKSIWLRAPVQTSAVEFHRVLSQLFKTTAIIPFRFPTIFDGEEQLIARLREIASEYTALLGKFSDLVQMEIRVASHLFQQSPESGTQYLKQRQAATAVIDRVRAELRAKLSLVAQDWRERSSKEGVRAFVLIDREQLTDFRKLMLSTPVPQELTVRASGPWPPSEFMEQS